ncbi:hypothetical protein AKJ09_08025 [Labilithrix luteola]|uniref:Uncharacterized protein n=2 Tax=Labilithrix luteola TaxID=1391654 RepID=A0A0K1Q6T7_9BACT|nr:hypothetical protein AKJ09_08025 [Labilithrix luteola]
MMSVAGMIALSVGACQSEQKSEQKLCAAASSFRVHVAELDRMTPQSTVAELRAATDRVNNDANEIQRTARKMNTPTAEQFNAAVKQLKRDSDAMPSNATLGDVQGQLATDVRNVRITGQALTTEAGCPA